MEKSDLRASTPSGRSGNSYSAAIYEKARHPAEVNAGRMTRR
jgi:hypothetical protein